MNTGGVTKQADEDRRGSWKRGTWGGRHAAAQKKAEEAVEKVRQLEGKLADLEEKLRNERAAAAQDARLAAQEAAVRLYCIVVLMQWTLHGWNCSALFGSKGNCILALLCTALLVA